MIYLYIYLFINYIQIILSFQNPILVDFIVELI